MISSIADFYNQSENSVRTFNEFVSNNDLHAATEVDHICYKCSSSDSFEHVRKLLEHESEFVYQSIISKRRIAFIKLKKGIVTSLGTIWFLELSDQKPDNSQEEGFDHIEIIPTEQSVSEFAELLQKAGLKIEKVVRPHHTTYDLELPDGFSIKLSTEPLVEKIRREEMK